MQNGPGGDGDFERKISGRADGPNGGEGNFGGMKFDFTPSSYLQHPRGHKKMKDSTAPGEKCSP